MTGLPVEGDDDSEQTHPVLVTKMDNTYASSPQIGLGSADLVVEELVEGGLTRLAAFYYSDLPDNVGPVRSMRASDIGIVSPVDATVVTSGAAAPTIARINDAGIPFYNEGDVGLSRDTSRSAPYNLFATSRRSRRTPRPTRPARRTTCRGATRRTSRAASPRRRSRRPSVAATPRTGRSTARATSTRTPTPPTATSSRPTPCWCCGSRSATPATSTRPATRSRRPSSTGKGEAMIFHDGKLVRGTWKKSDLDAPITLSTKAGELTVPAGHVWIELVPAANGDVTFSK